jgi:hypothetical protein
VQLTQKENDDVEETSPAPFLIPMAMPFYVVTAIKFEKEKRKKSSPIRGIEINDICHIYGFILLVTFLTRHLLYYYFLFLMITRHLLCNLAASTLGPSSARLRKV